MKKQLLFPDDYGHPVNNDDCSIIHLTVEMNLALFLMSFTFFVSFLRFALKMSPPAST